MRFEIGTGGIVAIMLGVVVLSGVVFYEGIQAGYDIEHEEHQETPQTATTYPLQAIPAAENSPAMAPAAAVSTSTPAASSLAAHASPPPLANRIAVTANHAGAASGAGAATPSHQRIVSERMPPSVPLKAPPPGREETASVPPEAAAPSESAATAEAIPPAPSMASTEGPAAPRMAHKPYNIQIQVAMDLSGANQMMKRLLQLGYQPHLVPTNISGQTWYKVEVGPYATQDEAAAAESQLRQKYNSTYGGGAPAQPNDSNSE
jgi:cell division septation protein DedD